MSFGGSGSIHTEETRAVALRINQSAYGGAKTRVWGKFRVPGNLLDYMDFTAIPHTTTQSSGGKGGEVSSSFTSYTYTAGVVIGLCTGQVSGVGKVWQDKDITDISTLGLELKNGALRQSPWAHTTANYPDRAISYSGIAYVSNATLDLGSSSSPPNLNFEVFGERIISGGDDAAPSDIISDIVTDPLEGVGLSASILPNMDDYALWCREMGLSLSVGAKSQVASRELISQILKATMAEAIWSAGVIKIIPYGDEPIGAWSPSQTANYSLTEADFIDAPRHKRTQPADAINRVTLNYSSRAKDYNTVTITRDDLSAVTQYGPRPETLDLPCITREAVAVAVCEFWRDRELYIRNRWEFTVDERFCLVEVMDLLTITFGPQQLSNVPVRVVEIDDDGRGKITMTVEEWPFGLLKATAIPTQTISGYVPEHNVAPGATNTPVIFEAPNYLTAPNLEIWIGASGGAHWGGAYVCASDDGNSYQQIGVITNPAKHGVLTSALATGSDPDTTHTLYVDMSISGGQLLSGSQTDADNGNTACWVDGEIIAYQNADLTTPDHYSLTYLRRGLSGTVSASHAAGSKIIRLNDAVFKYRVPRERIGSPIFIKLQSFNTYGRSPEPLDTVTAHMYTISGNKPLALTSLSAEGGLFSVDTAWTTQPGSIGIDYVEIWGNTTNNRTTAFQLTSQKQPTAKWKHPGLQPGQSWYYWGRVIDTSGNASDFYPASALAGVYAKPSEDAGSLLAQLTGQLGMPQLASDLAAPISLIPGMSQDILQRAVDIDELSSRALFERAVTDATISVDPVTGQINLLATANLTTNVEARLTQVESDLNAAEGSLSNTVATVSQMGTDLTSTQSQVTQLSGQVSTKASTVYVDQAVNTATGALTVEAANNAQALAQAAIRQALGLDVATDKELAARARIALAEQTLTTQANDLAAEATARLTLATALNGSVAALEQESQTTADALGNVEAKWGLKTQVVADGKIVVAGLELLSGAQSGAVFAVLADKLIVYKPDGSGQPTQMLLLGQVNGATALVLNGNLVADGSVIARHLSANSITAENGAIKDLAVSTLKLANNAVTVPLFADYPYGLFAGNSAGACSADQSFELASGVVSDAPGAQCLVIFTVMTGTAPGGGYYQCGPGGAYKSRTAEYQIGKCLAQYDCIGQAATTRKAGVAIYVDGVRQKIVFMDGNTGDTGWAFFGTFTASVTLGAGASSTVSVRAFGYAQSGSIGFFVQCPPYSMTLLTVKK